jgi:isocitrate/isopropylmalate dehydrogenase
MLRYLNENAVAAHILIALKTVLRSGKVRTPDLGGTATTREFVDAISQEMELKASR